MPAAPITMKISRKDAKPLSLLFFAPLRLGERLFSHQHIWTLGNLPLYHRDPFDRLLIAQAIHEGYTLVTADPIFKAYPVKLLS